MEIIEASFCPLWLSWRDRYSFKIKVPEKDDIILRIKQKIKSISTKLVIIIIIIIIIFIHIMNLVF